MLGDGGSDPLTTTPRLFTTMRLITRNSKPISPINATAPIPIPALAPVDRPVSELSGFDVPSAAVAAVVVVVVVVVVTAAAALVVADDRLVELAIVLVVLAALAVVVKKTSACVALPSSAATKSLCGQPAVLVQALLEQHPIKGVLSAEHKYHSALVSVQLCAAIPW